MNSLVPSIKISLIRSDCSQEKSLPARTINLTKLVRMTQDAFAFTTQGK